MLSTSTMKPGPMRSWLFRTPTRTPTPTRKTIEYEYEYRDAEYEYRDAEYETKQLPSIGPPSVNAFAPKIPLKAAGVVFHAGRFLLTPCR